MFWGFRYLVFGAVRGVGFVGQRVQGASYNLRIVIFVESLGAVNGVVVVIAT
jgi:hypothetical protein